MGDINEMADWATCATRAGRWDDACRAAGVCGVISNDAKAVTGLYSADRRALIGNGRAEATRNRQVRTEGRAAGETVRNVPTRNIIGVPVFGFGDLKVEISFDAAPVAGPSAQEEDLHVAPTRNTRPFWTDVCYS
ncbi:MAG TPA: hypothetical protein VF595_02205 [Tepidisphaeraceae bacterium]|jgi:hypothetical protein